MTATPSQQQRLAAARGRLLLWVGAIVFLLQLFAALGHAHERESAGQDCVTCSVQAQTHAAPPAPLAAPAAVALVLARIVSPLAIGSCPRSCASYLLPQPHAPPALLDAR